MKWYSVKKHNASDEMGLFLVVDKEGDFYLATPTYGSQKKVIWEDENGDKLDGITHFCILDPVSMFQLIGTLLANNDKEIEE